VAVVVNVAAGCINILSTLVDVTAEASSRLFFDNSELPTALIDDLSSPLFSAVSFSCGSLLGSCVTLLAFICVAVVASVTASTAVVVVVVAAAAAATLSRDFNFRSKVDVRLASRSLPMGCNREII
jgi:hypothetical protein